MFMLKIVDDYSNDYPSSISERWLVWALLRYQFKSIQEYWEGRKELTS